MCRISTGSSEIGKIHPEMLFPGGGGSHKILCSLVFYEDTRCTRLGKNLSLRHVCH